MMKGFTKLKGRLLLTCFLLRDDIVLIRLSCRHLHFDGENSSGFVGK